MDLAQYEQKDACEYQLETPGGDKLDVVFQLAGPSHPKRRERDRRLTARALREFNRKGKQQIDDDPDELFDRQTENLVAGTLGWKNLVIDAQPVPWSEDAARKLYADPRFEWVRTQVAAAMADIGNFIPGSSRS